MHWQMPGKASPYCHNSSISAGAIQCRPRRYKGMVQMNFAEIKEKYFVIVEGEDRAIVRDSEAQAEKTRKRLSKFSGGKKIYIYKAEQKNG